MNAIDYFFENTSTLDKVFLVGREEINYRDLHSEVIDLASWLNQKIGAGKNIIVLSVNNLFMTRAYLAIIKSGNICIPLDPFIEQDNFDYIRDLTEPQMIFVTHDINKRLNLDPEILVYPDTIQGTGVEPGVSRVHKKETQPPPHNSDLNFDPEQLAEIIFTSGSTGKPKGVMLSHKNLIANTSSIVEYLELDRTDRMLVVLPFYYCYGLSLLHTHLRVGGSLVFNNSFIFLGGVIKDLLEYKCTGFAGVPTHFQVLLRKSDSFKKTSFPELKYVTQAGGGLAPVFIDEFKEAHPGIKFIVMYGQTEATARLSWLPPGIYESKRGSIGKGIPGVELKVVNEMGKQIKPGETGEIIARGDNIMKGYFQDEEGTKKTIRDGWLNTGDLGTVDDDGYIYLTARSKEIIKVRGKRISPKEVEAVILNIPGVIDVTVKGIEDEVEGETLKALIVIRKDEKDKLTREFIRRHCSQHLAIYKIPGIYEFRDNIVISHTGKKIKGSHLAENYP